jgi:hypothetical protein
MRLISGNKPEKLSGLRWPERFFWFLPVAALLSRFARFQYREVAGRVTFVISVVIEQQHAVVVFG